MEEDRMWFKPSNSVSFPCSIVSMANIAKRYRRDCGGTAYWRMRYADYCKLQSDAHKFYGCNLKRALRKFGCKNKVKHQTKNGYWVWMK